ADVKDFEFVNQSGEELIIDNISIWTGRRKGRVGSSVDTSDYIFMQVGNNKAYHRDNRIPLNIIDSKVEVIAEDSIIYVPLKFFNECYEFPLTWNTDENFAKFTTDREVVVGENSSIINKGGHEYKFENPTKIIDGNLYITIPMVERIFNKKSVITDENIIIIADEDINLGKIDEKLNIITVGLNGDNSEGKLATLDFTKAESFVKKDIIKSAWLSGEYGEKQIVPVKDMPFKEAVSIDTAVKPPGDYWTYKFAFGTTADLKEGDVCLFSFYARATRTTDESNNAQFEVVLEQNTNPWTKSVVSPAGVTSEWKKYYVPFVARKNNLAGETEINFRIGYRPQTIEIAEFEAYNFKDNYTVIDMPVTAGTYEGREDDAPWRKKCIDDIEKNRKHDTTVKVVDKNGMPIENAKVSLKMKEQNVNFGTSVSQWYLTGYNFNNTEQGRRDINHYQETLLKYFNTAVPENAYKWVLWEDGRKTNSRAVADWLLDN
ncbi:MAG: hypothetical protein RR957_07890, partial [Oscillospiraceae bacterium]